MLSEFASHPGDRAMKNVSHPLRSLLMIAVVLSSVTALAASHKKTIIYNFTDGNDGGLPFAGPIFDSRGNLYSTTYAGGDQGCNQGGNYCGTVDMFSPPAKGSLWTETTIYTFGNQYNDGSTPISGLTFDNKGNLYGSTELGEGEVYQLVPGPDNNWTSNWLYASVRDYQIPVPVVDSSGNVYDTDVFPNNNAGDVFEVSPNGNGGWTTTVLHNFNGKDGYAPGALTLGPSGDIYGVTSGGGDLNCNPTVGCGVVFRLTPPTKKGGEWGYEDIFHFHGGDGGAFPSLAVVFDAQGNLYGSASYEGKETCPKGVECDVVFKLSPPTENGKFWTETVLHTFLGTPDGAWISGSVTVDGKGNVYGTSRYGGNGPCSAGGTLAGCGTVFELSPPSANGKHWTESLWYQFQNGSDGALPYGSVVFDSKGNLYSTTSFGGKHNKGTVFQLTP
jgi:uncharacterized repeat protein (TIGR03803 family)